MKIKNLYLLVSPVLLVLTACNQKQEIKSESIVSGDDIKNYLSVIANDSLQGRKPFTIGEEKTIHYIAAQFKQLGLEPGNNGKYYQDVPMVEIPVNRQAICKSRGKVIYRLNLILIL